MLFIPVVEIGNQYLFLPAVSGPVSDSESCCVNVLTEKYICNDLQPKREQNTGQQQVQGRVINHNISKHGFSSEKGSFSLNLDPRNV